MQQNFYCLELSDEALKNMQIPTEAEVAAGHQPKGVLSEVMHAVKMSVVRPEKLKTDWYRTPYFRLSSPEAFWEPPLPAEILQQSGEAASLNLRNKFFREISEKVGTEISEYFEKYFHQQGFDGLGRTLVQWLLYEKFNKKRVSEKEITLVELAQSFGNAHYFFCRCEGCLEYKMYNAYDYQRTTDMRDFDTQQKSLPLLLELSGKITYDAQQDKITHQIQGMSFVSDNPELEKQLEDFLDISPARNILQRIGQFFIQPTEQSHLFRYNVRKASRELIDFQERCIAGQIKNLIREQGGTEEGPEFDDLRDLFTPCSKGLQFSQNKTADPEDSLKVVSLLQKKL